MRRRKKGNSILTLVDYFLRCVSSHIWFVLQFYFLFFIYTCLDQGHRKGDEETAGIQAEAGTES